MSLTLHYRLLSSQAQAPAYMSPGAAGMDLYASLATPVIVRPGEMRTIPTGVALEIPEGYEGQVRPRSGLARDYWVTVCNAPGTVDSDYRGEICVMLMNHGQRALAVNPGDRVAQLVISPVQRVSLEEVGALSETERGGGGFGSTGVR